MRLTSPNSAMCIMVGPFPPPVIGSAVVTSALHDVLVLEGYAVSEINSSAAQLVQERFFQRTFRRLCVSGALAFELARCRSRTTVYISCAGSAGLIGDLLNVILARLVRCPIILHHHSFAYLRQNRLLAKWVFAIAGHRTRHIFLCATMRRQAMRQYPSIRRGYILSNAALISLPQPGKSFGPLRRIGFFSNLALTKGIDRFLDLACTLRGKNADIVFDVAGPYLDSVSRQLTETAVREGLITYHGALEQSAKQNFFEAIDVLVLPSRYAHEAEPLVILEALAAGIPVIATDRGCIAEMIGDALGSLLDANADDLAPAICQIETWISQPDVFSAARQAVSTRGAQLREKGLAELKALIRHMAWRPQSLK